MKVSRLAGLLLASGLTSQALAAGNPERGAKLARLWCSSCHLVGKGQTTATDAPPFASIARRSPDEPALRAFLMQPHAPMPNFNLSRKKIDDLMAYIASLRRGD